MAAQGFLSAEPTGPACTETEKLKKQQFHKKGTNAALNVTTFQKRAFITWMRNPPTSENQAVFSYS